MVFQAKLESAGVTARKSRRASPSSPPDILGFPHAPEDIPDKTEKLRKELFAAGWNKEAVENYLTDYMAAREKVIRSFEHIRPIYDYCWKLMQDWPDKRSPEMIIHPLFQVMTAAFFAFCSGANDCAGVSHYWRNFNCFFQALFPWFPSPARTVSATAVSVCINIVGPDNMHALFKEMFAKVLIDGAKLEDYKSGFLHGCTNPAYAGAAPVKPLITIGGDGQTAEGASRAGLFDRHCKGLEIASIFNCTDRVTADCRIDSKKNQETGSFMEMLKKLLVLDNGVIFMCDALNSRPQLSAELLKNGAHYLLPIKRNEGSRKLFEELITAFEKASFDEVPDELKPRTFKVGPCHGRVEEYQISILPADSLGDPSVNKHAGTPCLVLKIKRSQNIRKRQPTNEADAQRRQNSIRHGADRITAAKQVYICSLPYCADSFNQILQSLNCCWSGVEAAHGRLDRYAARQDEIRGLSHLNCIQNRVGCNKIILHFLSCARQIYTHEKYAAPTYKRRKSNAEVLPVSYADVMHRFAGDPLKLTKLFCDYWGKLNESPEEVEQTAPKKEITII